MMLWSIAAETPAAFRRITVRDLMIDAPIGVYDHEKQAPQPIRVNIDLLIEATGTRGRRVFVPGKLAPGSDIPPIVCYEALADAVRELARAQHTDLVETLLDAVADLCMTDGRVEAALVRIEKTQAVPGTSAVGVEALRRRE